MTCGSSKAQAWLSLSTSHPDGSVNYGDALSWRWHTSFRTTADVFHLLTK